MELAIPLEINGKIQAIPVRLLENVELDSEDDDIYTASQLWFDYQGVSYEVDLPEKESPDWWEVLEIIDPE